MTTTKVQRFFSENLLEQNESLVLDRAKWSAHKSSYVPGAITFLAARAHGSISLEALSNECCRAVQEFMHHNHLLHSFHLWLFAVVRTWSPRQFSQKHATMWSAHDLLSPIAASSTRRSEFEMPRDTESHFVGVIEVPIAHISDAIEFCRVDRSGLLFLSSRTNVASEAAIRDLYSCTFPLDRRGKQVSAVDWTSGLAHLLPMGDMVIRPTGSFDDPDVSIDIIGESGFLNALRADGGTPS